MTVTKQTITRRRKGISRGLLGTGLVFGLAGLLFVGLTLSVRSAPQGVPEAAPIPTKVAPQVWEATADGGETDFLVVLTEQADVSAAATLSSREARLRCVYDILRKVAQRSQAPLRAELDSAGVAYRSFYIVNMLAVNGGDRALIKRLSDRSEVARITANPKVRQALPDPQSGGGRRLAPQAIEWNVARVNADDVWALGYTGQEIVVAGQDTGYDWDHPALINQYRGYNGVVATHDYNWHDAIHSGGGSCGADSPVPCDDYSSSHGTHTMGTIVGDDGGSNQIGVAPGARWIGCRNMDVGVGSPATYAECFEFFLAPYPIGGDPLTDGIPSLAPHVINNSWTCPPSEGCDWDTLQAVVESVRAAGIVIVASAGNSGSSCSTVRDPIAIYDAAFSVGMTNSSDNISSLSSRGPVTVDGSGRLKPDVSAPGVSIRSSVRGGGYSLSSGTSMAGPHVAGTVALLWSAAPGLIGDVDTTEWLIMQTARPRTTTQSCGDDSPGDVPNNVYGWGIVDALAAVRASAELTVTKQSRPALALPGTQLTYTLRVTNTGDVALTAIITDHLPHGIMPGETADGTTIVPGGTLTWMPVVLAPEDVWMETVVVTVEVGYTGWLTNVVQVTTDMGVTGVYTATSATPMPAVAVSKQASSDVASPGGPLTYTLHVTNTGNVTLTATVTDDLPSHIIPGETDDGTAIVPGGTLTWTPVILGPGDVWAETVVVTLEADHAGGVTNVVRVTTLEGATGVYTHALAPAPAVTKRTDANLVLPGSQLIYTISFTNTFSFTLTQVVLTDAVPAGTDFAWASGDHAWAGDLVTWTAPSLVSQGTLTATLAVTVGHLPPGTCVSNEAYGVRASELLTPVMGAPVRVTVPWRCTLLVILREWSFLVLRRDQP